MSGLRTLRTALRPLRHQVATFHASPPARADKPNADSKPATVAATVPPVSPPEEATKGGLAARFAVTAEVTVSKIFPAGFGWQASSILADNMGYEATDLEFFGITGLGDGIGVLAGHTTFYSLKMASGMDPSLQMGRILGDGVWLGTAAFCSGFAWQPIVNFWQGLEVPFNTVFAGTWVGCGLTFLGGLRLGRLMYPFVGAGNAANFTTDAALSSTIGAATGFFVGTDTAYLAGDGNWLRPVVGIEDGTSNVVGCVTAGTSTALGFVVAQSAQNLVYPKGQCWLDP